MGKQACEEIGAGVVDLSFQTPGARKIRTRCDAVPLAGPAGTPICFVFRCRGSAAAPLTGQFERFH